MLPEVKDDVPRPSQQTPKSPHPTPSYTWFSTRQEAERHHIQPTQALPQPLGLLSSSSGCCFLSGRAESSGAGPQIS